MKVGVDTFTIRDLHLDPYKTLDYLKDRGFEGAQFGSVRGFSETLDPGVMRDIRMYGDSMNMYTHVSVSPVNPVIFKGTFDDLKDRIVREITAAAKGNWHELHSVINMESERYEHKAPWPMHVDECIKLINSLRPALEKYGSRINIETHGEATFDVLKVIECTSPYLVGVCLDTANTLVNCEDPVLAAKRVAPYTHLTHTKDAIISFCEEGLIRQGKPPGMGDVNFEKILPILGEYSPELPLSIEDHKWLFKARIFEEEWISKNPELSPFEMGQVVKLAWETQKKIFNGSIPTIAEYEKTDYLDEMEDRLAFGRDYLNKLLTKLNLRH